MNNKKLYRSTSSKMLAGVCGGLADYFGTDPTIVRLAVVVLGLITGPLSLIAYIVGVAIIPTDTEIQ